MLRCGACGRRLIGDSGRYRHLDPCDEFASARRTLAFKNRKVRAKGYSHPAALYENLIPTVLDKVALTATDLVEAADIYAAADSTSAIDEVGLRRIARQRDAALARYAATRDTAALEAAMERLDAEEAALRTPTASRPDWSEVCAILRDLPAMWRDATDEDRRLLAEQVIESVDALGARQVTVNFRAGVQAVVSVGARGFDTTVTITRTPFRVNRVG